MYYHKISQEEMQDAFIFSCLNTLAYNNLHYTKCEEKVLKNLSNRF